MESTGAATALFAFASLFFGACVGSFLNVAIYRLPREGLSLTRPARSFCPECKSQIAWHDNIPVIAWLLLSGRCRTCHAPIPFRYPLVEMICAALSLVIFQAEGPTVAYLGYFYFAACLVGVSFIDIELMVIPNALVRPTQIVALIVAAASPRPRLAGDHLWSYLAAGGWPDLMISLAGSILAGLAGFLSLYLVAGLYKLLKGRKGLGEGDPPLLGMIAMFLGLPSILPVLLLSSLLALAAVAVMVSSGRLRADRLSSRPIPFGPFLSLAGLAYHIIGQGFMAWYFSLMAP
jgi:leader peptidase (prepilin peptidase)/N-methyltransferase